MFSHCQGSRRFRAYGRVFHRGPIGANGGGGGAMRRPLRFLIERLGLDDAQATAVSKAIEALRLEREQAQLDQRRARAQLADQFEGDVLDPAKLAEAAEVRVTAATRERDAIVAAVTRLHQALKPEQRVRLAMLLRAGPFLM